MASWFRSWHGAPTDPKWLLIAKRAGVTPGMVSSVFWALLDYASQESDRGSVRGFDAESYAAWAGYEEHQVIDILIAMEGKGVIAGGRLTAWNERQPEEDRTNAARQAAWRKRQRGSNGNGSEPEDSDGSNTLRNVTNDKSRVEESRSEVVAVATTGEPPLPLSAPDNNERMPAEEYRKWVREYERTQGLLISSPYEGDKVHYWGQHVTFDGWSYALQQANDNRQRGRWSYIETILKRIEHEGVPMAAEVKAAASGPKQVRGDLSALLQ